MHSVLVFCFVGVVVVFCLCSNNVISNNNKNLFIFFKAESIIRKSDAFFLAYNQK